MNKRIIKQLAFTLAEVLIVLGIIGVVAELTIPSLLVSYQKQVYTTSAKKFFSNFNQGLKLMALNNSCFDDLACTDVFSKTIDLVGDEIVKNFKLAKNCKITTTDTCFSGEQNKGYGGSGTSVSINESNIYYKFVTMDGMSVAIQKHNNNCANAWSISGEGPMSKTCGYVFVDVNNTKGPNRIGRDIFTFWITSGKGASLYPDGGSDDKGNGTSGRPWTNGTCTPTNSFQCTGQVVEENWEMNY